MVLFDTLKGLVVNVQEKRKQSQFEGLLSDSRTITRLERYLTPKDRELQAQLICLIGDGKINQVKGILDKLYSGLGQNTCTEKLDILKQFLSPAGMDRNLGFSARKKSALAMALSISAYLVLDKNIHRFIKENHTETEALMPNVRATMNTADRIIRNKKIKDLLVDK